jgi:limonene-1,2-epoxide hydrolase
VVDGHVQRARREGVAPLRVPDDHVGIGADPEVALRRPHPERARRRLAHNRSQSAVVIRPATTPSDCVWQQSGFPTTKGPDEAVALLESMIESLGLASIDVEYLHIASSEDVVFTERLDWLVQRDGTRMGPAVVVGVTEFRDGKICAWREDMDTSSFAHMLDSRGTAIRRSA